MDPPVIDASRHCLDFGRACYFGEPGHALFGWLHGDVESRSQTGVVICNTFGSESLSAYRSLRHLAGRLAHAGIPVLRFDFSGTGNSADFADANASLPKFETDVRTAIAALLEYAGVERVVLVGLRLGALVAFRAATQQVVDGLVLWAPVVNGKRFVREWKRIARANEIPDDAEDGAINASGFVLQASLLAEIADTDLLRLEPAGKPACFIVDRDDFPREDSLFDYCGSSGFDTARSQPPGFISGIVNDPHLTELPTQAIDEITGWITHLGGSVPATETWRTASAIAERRSAVSLRYEGVPIVESVLESESGSDDAPRGPFGIVTAPADPEARNGRCLILLNAGSVHHIGLNRMHVDIARRLAASGTVVCRADLSGIGDSPARTGARENDPYPAAAIDNVAHLVARIRTSVAPDSVALAGTCSGAWASFHAALAIEDISDIVLINADFYGERSIFGKPPTLIRPKDYVRLKHAARSWSKWKRLLSGKADIARIIRILLTQCRLRAGLLKIRIAGDDHQLDIDLARLAARAVRVSLIYSPGDGAEEFLGLHGRKGREVLARSNLLREYTVIGSDHTFTPRAAQRRLGDVLQQWFG